MTTTERATVRSLIRYAVVMAIVGLLVGVSYQESAKKLPFSEIDGGQHLEAVIHLALVHGHVFTLGVLLPLAMAGALVLARKAGGAEVPAWAQRTLTRGYLPFAAASLVLQLYKGYHFLLMARAGERDFAVMDDAFMGGIHALRYGIYAVVHSGMGITLGVFLVVLWRSLGSKNNQSE
jgi:hypothetical protein